jgi:predicted O-methyltransferase YrrM
MNQAGFTPIVAQPRRWDVLANFMTAQGYKTFVEVGCKEGRTTGHILKTVPDSRVIAIDPWIADPAPANGDPTREDYKAWDFAKIEREFWENVGDAKDRCSMWRMTSAEAASKFYHQWPWPPTIAEKADLVFIDALHDYESVLQDFRLWWPHVRVGGLIATHDFNHKWPGVERAVADSFNLMEVGIASDSVAFVIKSHEDQLRASHAHPEKAP